MSRPALDEAMQWWEVAHIAHEADPDEQPEEVDENDADE